MTYKIIDYSPELDLSNFYIENQKRGLENNSSQAAMFDCFKNEKEWKGWVVEYRGKYIGGVCLHTFDDVMGKDSYRILTRCCWHTEFSAKPTGYVKGHFLKQQNPGLQIFTAMTVGYLGKDKKMYSTSHQGSSKVVHNLWFPEQEKRGIFKNVGEIMYRNCLQTVWELNVDEYINQMKMYPRWDCDFPIPAVEKLFND